MYSLLKKRPPLSLEMAIFRVPKQIQPGEALLLPFFHPPIKFLAMHARKLVSAFLCLFIAAASIAQEKPTKSCKPCESFRQLNLPDVSIQKSESLLRDTVFVSPFDPPAIVTVPFCRLEGVIGREIGFEIYLPQQWNGRFLMSGNGGFAGSFQNNLAGYVNQGFAIGATNTGHREATGIQADWALNNMERQINFGHLAVHRTTVVLKSIIQIAYCKPAAYAYFLGCSRGGGQALMEAQRYPDDFDGIVSGAPAFGWPAIGAKGISILQKNYPDPKNLTNPIITNENLKWLQEFVCKECDMLDGLSDCILNEPNACKVDLNKLPRCPGDTAGKDCFTAAQVDVLKSIFEPFMVDGKEVYPGYPHGLEAIQGGIDLWIAGTSPMLKPSLHHYFGTGIFKYLVYNDPNWNYKSYTFQDFFRSTAYASAYLDATNPDYSAFKQSKGKLIIYHGWNDPALSANATIGHYEEAMKKDTDLGSFVRLFLMPGVLHCAGGPGADEVDYVQLIRDWVEKGKAPEKVVFEKKEKGKTVLTRPVYPYPKVTVYDGKGDPTKESSFILKK
jgi:Tannase and feruloyl esterase